MPFYLLHAGTALQKLSVLGNLQTLDLPAGVTVVNTRPMRAALLNRVVVIVNSPSVNLALDPATMALRKLTPAAPGTTPTLAASLLAGGPNGTYRYAVTFAVKSSGSIIAESAFSPIAGPVTVTDKKVDLTAIPVSLDAEINCRRLYRTTNGGTDYFELADIDDNTTATYTDSATDYDLGLLPSTSIVAAPPGIDGTNRFRVIAAWKNRIWAAEATAPDRLHYSAQDKPWAFEGKFKIKPVGVDEYGVSGLLARRDELGVLKRRAVWKIVGTDEDDFRDIQIAEGPGSESPDACLVVRDRGFFLGENAFWEWGPEGVKNVARDLVHPWFASDDFFNRARFKNAFACYNAKADSINLFLAGAGSEVENRWVSFDLRRRIWLGPHRTDAFNPTAAGTMENAGASIVPMVGSSDGFIYQPQSTASDDGIAIDFEVVTKFHSGNAPDIEHYWGELSVISKVQAAGTLSIIPTVGGLDSTAGATISVDMTKGRQRLRRLGTGRLCSLTFKEATVGQQVEIYGYELPFHELGRR